MEYFIALAVVVLLIFATVKLAGGDRYENMSSGEFEAEAKRGSRMGGAKCGDRPDTGPWGRSENKDEK